MPSVHAPSTSNTLTTQSNTLTTESIKVSGKWEQWPSGWYFKKKDGSYATGFIQPNSDTRVYYLNGKGLMKTGWIKVGDKWYWAASSGALHSGWKKLKGKWYYLDPKVPTHPAVTGFFSDGKARYYTHPTSCAMKTGWIKVDGTWYYANSNGSLAKGWKKLDTWYYLDPAQENYPALASKKFSVSGKEYYVKNDCRLVINGWAKISSTEERWADSSGALLDFYADRSDGDLRIRNGAGEALTGWQQAGKVWFYIQPNNGKLAKGWLKINGTWYYFDKNYSWYSISGNNELDSYLISIIEKNNYSLKKCFNDVAYNYSYRTSSHASGKNWSIKFALDMAKKKSGNCYRYAALFAWLAKGLGYNATAVTGTVPSAAGGQAPHGWVEIKYKGKTYICDPELQQAAPTRNWYWQTYSSAPTVYTKN